MNHLQPGWNCTMLDMNHDLMELVWSYIRAGSYPEWPYRGAEKIEALYQKKGIDAVGDLIRSIRRDPESDASKIQCNVVRQLPRFQRLEIIHTATHWVTPSVHFSLVREFHKTCINTNGSSWKYSTHTRCEFQRWKRLQTLVSTPILSISTITSIPTVGILI